MSKRNSTLTSGWAPPSPERKYCRLIAATHGALDREIAPAQGALELLPVDWGIKVRTVAGEEVEVVGITVTQMVRRQGGAAGEVERVRLVLRFEERLEKPSLGVGEMAPSEK